MVFALQKLSPALVESLADYPPWLVVACATIVTAVLIWLLVKVLKWALWVLLIVVLVAGAATAVKLWLG
ncbi:MAG: hypothetical protein WCG63_02130 [Opitutaceae bacterium]|jgi:hypothetical protein